MVFDFCCDVAYEELVQALDEKEEAHRDGFHHVIAHEEVDTARSSTDYHDEVSGETPSFTIHSLSIGVKNHAYLPDNSDNDCN